MACLQRTVVVEAASEPHRGVHEVDEDAQEVDDNSIECCDVQFANACGI